MPKKNAPRSKPPPRPPCILCGGRNDGIGDICTNCVGSAAGTDVSRRVATRVRDRVQGGETGGFICPYCRFELSWENLKTSEIEVTIYVREKIYYCPKCRAFLGVSSWHTEG